MTSLDLLHIPTPWHNSVVQLADSNIILVTKAKLARAALAAGTMTGGLAKTESGRAYFALAKKDAAPTTADTAPATTVSEVVEVVEVVEVNDKKDTTVTVTVTVKAQEEEDVPAAGQTLKRRTFSEKADAVVTAVTRRNTGSLHAPAKGGKHDSWLGRLRWLLSLFWPRTL